MPLYEPQEDSALLKQAVEEHAVGDVLDMGTGSGILAFAAAEKPDVTSVLAVDIDEESLADARRRLAEFTDAKTPWAQKVTLLRSDLFADIAPGVAFDTIKPAVPAARTGRRAPSLVWGRWGVRAPHPLPRRGANALEAKREYPPPLQQPHQQGTRRPETAAA